ncbi:hypothetical protein [Phytoactinopolyspora halotolerans]|uniref:Uncharacterized protein n=1 Tax=Phytoactinopolyspora halotolerans TaxID=1981512 RepID=A0A6L9SIA3_9ACTN|nr:hypothetical protein [Phytoactinopolyspora halotolerans]NEE04408.1 hypothetical protein [Phytoactinopolyspora halotolerans]
MGIQRDLDELDDRTAEDLLSGRFRGDDVGLDDLATFVDELRAGAAGAAPPAARPDLTAVFRSGLPTEPAHAATAVAPPPRWRPKHRRRPAFTGLGAALASATGKVLLGTAAAVVTVGAAHVAEVVRIPGLPGPAPVAEESPLGEGSEATSESDQPAQEAGASAEPEAVEAPGFSADGRSAADTETAPADHTGDNPGSDDSGDDGSADTEHAHGCAEGDEGDDEAADGEDEASDGGQQTGSEVSEEAAEDGGPAHEQTPPACSDDDEKDSDGKDKPDTPANTVSPSPGPDSNPSDERKPETVPQGGGDKGDVRRPEPPSGERP